MYSNTPTSKFLVLAPTQSGPDAVVASDCPQLDTPSTPASSSASTTSTTTITTSNSNSFGYDESGFLYLGYHQPIARRTTLSDSDTESIPEPGSVSTISPAAQSGLQCLPLTGKEWKPVVTSSLPKGTVPERFTTTPLFLNF